MTETDDHELLGEFARSESEAAFATLAARHVPLVYSAALRFSGNPHHADEITQAVFIILARKAKRISQRTILSGWLYQTARLTAANHLKRERRRQCREQEAYMQSTLANDAEAKAWPEIAPWLDEAMGDLGEADRNAVVLRYFEHKTAAEVAVALRTTEAAAQKRLARALEKLRKVFGRRGITLTATLIASAISAHSVHAAPPGVLATLSSTATQTTLASASLTTLVNGTMKTMFWIKMKLASGAISVALLAGGAVTVAMSQATHDPRADEAHLSPDEIFQKSHDAYASLTSYTDQGKVIAVLNGVTLTHTFAVKLARPNLYRIDWEQRSESADYKSPGPSLQQAVWSDGAGHFLETSGKVSERPSMANSLASATGISGGAAATVPGAFFDLNWPNRTGRSAAGFVPRAKEKVGEEDCYVFVKSAKGRTITLWIGMHDFLIRQVRTTTSAEAMKPILAEGARANPNTSLPPWPDSQEITSTETHERIEANRKLSPADFTR